MVENHEDGRREYGEQEFLDAIRDNENPTTSDVARSVGCTPQAALYRLNTLKDEDRVSSTEIGTARVWTVE